MFNFTVYWQAQSGDLVLRRVTSRLAGTYVCSAYNNVLTRSVTSSHYTHVNVITPSPSDVISDHKTSPEVITYQEKYILQAGKCTLLSIYCKLS